MQWGFDDAVAGFWICNVLRGDAGGLGEVVWKVLSCKWGVMGSEEVLFGSSIVEHCSGCCWGGLFSDSILGTRSIHRFWLLQTEFIGFKNFLFLSVILRLPSTLTVYLFPDWFCIWTSCPIDSG